jgi:hypothetical protein
MSEQDRQERINETLALLGRMTPTGLTVNRDDLFFRAGEASARGELDASRSWRHRVWPAIAATLALIATGLGYSLVSRRPEIQVVYVKRASAKTDNQGAVIEIEAPPTSSSEEDPSQMRMASRYARNNLRPGPTSNIIHPQDWAALSDAFAQQVRLQQEHSLTVQRADESLTDSPRGEARTYLELRDAMRAM